MNFNQWIAEQFPQLVGQVQLIPEVLERDAQQTEFTLTPWIYIDRLATNERQIIGQKYLVELNAELNRISDEYCVSPSLLLAIWGVETNFGRNLGTIPIGSALATLAFSGRIRRRPYFTAQLEYFCSGIHSQKGLRTPVCGSWAGASGHMQFMPETYVKFSASYDSDCPANIWESIPDALMSAANYLRVEGANSGEDLIKKPYIEPNIGYEWDGVHNACDAKVWLDRGLDIVNAIEAEKYFCVSPVGRHGPRILLGGQALALFQYNRSINYVLAVSKLATMIDGRQIDWAWNRTVRLLDRLEIADLQSVLNELGYDAGVSDGIIGPDTVRAVMQSQTACGIVADGYPDFELLSRLKALSN